MNIDKDKFDKTFKYRPHGNLENPLKKKDLGEMKAKHKKIMEGFGLHLGK